MYRSKPWESSYDPKHRRSRLDPDEDANPALSLADATMMSHPIGEHALLLKCDEWLVDAISYMLPPRIREVAKAYRISILNFGWRVEGLVINFRTGRDAAKFRMVWPDDETVQCVGVGQCKT